MPAETFYSTIESHITKQAAPLGIDTDELHKLSPREKEGDIKTWRNGKKIRHGLR